MTLESDFYTTKAAYEAAELTRENTLAEMYDAEHAVTAAAPGAAKEAAEAVLAEKDTAYATALKTLDTTFTTYQTLRNKFWD